MSTLSNYILHTQRVYFSNFWGDDEATELQALYEHALIEVSTLDSPHSLVWSLWMGFHLTKYYLTFIINSKWPIFDKKSGRSRSINLTVINMTHDSAHMKLKNTNFQQHHRKCIISTSFINFRIAKMSFAKKY